MVIDLDLVYFYCVRLKCFSVSLVCQFLFMFSCFHVFVWFFYSRYHVVHDVISPYLEVDYYSFR